GVEPCGFVTDHRFAQLAPLRERSFSHHRGVRLPQLQLRCRRRQRAGRQMFAIGTDSGNRSRPVRRFWRLLAVLPASLGGPLPALAQDNVLATAALPRDLSPWGMFLNAD